MRSILKRLAVVMLTGFLLAGAGGIWPYDAFAESVRDIQLNVRYGQTEARGMLADINDFRTGSEAWAWDSTNTQKVQYSGLNTLTYDYELEKVAMQRAAEIAVSFSHTRPNGEICFTAYPSAYSNTNRGENIAYGYTSANSVYMGWREDNDDYDGQGHRRNMLSSGYNSIGIGHVVYKGAHYWVQEFSSKVVDANESVANDSNTAVTISAVESIAKDFDNQDEEPSDDPDEEYPWDDPDDEEAWEEFYNAVEDAASLRDDSFGLTAKSGKKVNVALSPLSTDTAYQIRYSTDKKLKKSVKKINVAAGAKTAVLKKLKAKKTYYVQIRPVTLVTNNATGDYVIIAGKWSKTKKVKTKK